MSRTRAFRQATAAAGALLAAVAAAPAHAGPRADFTAVYGERTPGAPSALTIHLRYKAPDDPEGKPPPIRKVVLDAPEGTRFGNGHPVCAASDQELQLRGRDACPPEAQIGEGRVTVITGVQPVDPFATQVTIYATPEGFLELAQAEGTNATLAVERLRVKGTRIEAEPAVQPGPPPDGYSGIRDVDMRIARSAFVMTPPSCPPSGAWMWHGAFAFGDGGTASEMATTPCDATAQAGAGGTARSTGRLVVHPRRVHAGRVAHVRVRVPTTARCRAGAMVQLAGATARTGRSGRVTLAARLAPGRQVVRSTSDRAGCKPRAAVIRATS